MTFIILQSVLLFFMLFHDWIPVPPLNNIRALKEAKTTRFLASIINGGFVLIPLVLTLIYYPYFPPFVTILIFLFYLVLSIGTILSWWIPYFFGSSQKHRDQLKKYKNTHHFLPPIGNHVVPNTLHVILHLQIWICLGFSIGLLIS